MPFTTSTNNYSPAKWIVNATAGLGTHTTLTAANAAASSGDTIFLMSSVTENVTITPGVNITAWTGGTANTPSITGTLTMTGAGTSTLSGLELITNSADAISITGTANSILNINDCYLNASNNEFINFNTTGANAAININNCTGNIGSSTGFFTVGNGNVGNLTFRGCKITNSFGSAISSQPGNGTLGIYNCVLNFNITTASSAGLIMYNSTIDTSAINTNSLTINGSGTALVTHSYFASGSAIAVTASTTLNFYNNVVSSSNTNAISGAGTINFSDIIFNGSSSVISTTTQTAGYTNLGKYKSTGQPCFLATMTSAVTNAWGDNGTYTVVYKNSVFDQNSNYATGTGIFTAPVAGKYLFTTTTSLSNTGGTAVASANIALVATSRTLNAGGTAYITTDPNGFITLQGCWIVDMAANDTAQLKVNGITTASTKTGTFYGAAGAAFTWFAGHLIA